MKFRVDAMLYHSVSSRREKEWQLALLDLNSESDGKGPTLTVGLRPEGGVSISVTDSGIDEMVTLSKEALRPHFRDYRRVIDQLIRSTTTGTRQMETLDYAKKLVHDEAGEMVQDVLEPVLTLPHTLGRCLFTLLFLVSDSLPEELVTRHRHQS
jgi:uncharacterized protein (UPF0262 family)